MVLLSSLHMSPAHGHSNIHMKRAFFLRCTSRDTSGSWRLEMSRLKRDQLQSYAANDKKIELRMPNRKASPQTQPTQRLALCHETIDLHEVI